MKSFALKLGFIIALCCCAMAVLFLLPSGGLLHWKGHEGFTLSVLHTNDFHSRIVQFNRLGNVCNDRQAADGQCFGGVARLATMIKSLRARKTNTLLLDAGDQFQGSQFFSRYRGRAAMIFMNRLGYDTMALGNHEFDDGPAILSQFIRGLRFPVVSANIDVTREPSLRGLIKPYVVHRVGRRLVGVIGFIAEDTDATSRPGHTVRFKSIEASLRDAIAQLQERGVNIIIGLSHAGLSRDMQLAAAIEGLDIIVGGHTHSLLSNSDPQAEGAYPVQISSPSGNPVLVVTAYSWGKYLGNLQVNFDAMGIARSWSGEPVLLAGGVDRDSEILKTVERFSAEIEPLYNQIIGDAAIDLIGDRTLCRFTECGLGNLIADALLWEARNDGATIALVNGGGIRSSFQKGEITMARVIEVHPFGNTLATVKLTGANVRRVLEHGVSYATAFLGDGTGRFLQVCGLRFSWDESRPVGERIVAVEVSNDAGDYKPLDKAKIYNIVTTDFIRQGGDNYRILVEKAIDPYDYGRLITDILADYIRENSPRIATTARPHHQNQRLAAPLRRLANELKT